MAETKLDLLIQMVQKVLGGQKDIREDMREIKTRVARLETDVAQLHVYLAEQSTRPDRFSDRFERVERRLEIVGSSSWLACCTRQTRLELLIKNGTADVKAGRVSAA